MCLFKPKAPKVVKPPAPVQAPPPPTAPAKVARKRPTYGGKTKTRLRGTGRSDLKVAPPSGVNSSRGSGGVYSSNA